MVDVDEQTPNKTLAERNCAEALLAAWDKAFVHANGVELSEITTALAATNLQISQAPKSGFVMVTLRDSFNTAFHLGELLVTTAEARSGNAIGYAMVQGDEAERALCKAGVAAVLQDPEASPALVQNLNRILAAVLSRAENDLQLQSKLVASTRVAFESMAER